MGGLLIASRSSSPDVDRVLQASRKQFQLGGFDTPVTIDLGNFVIDYYSKIGDSAKNIVTFENGDFILSVGTLFYNGKIGVAALNELFRQADPAAELRAARGHFVVFMRKNGALTLLRDALGSIELFVVKESECISTSFLASAAASKKLSIKTQAVYEYVFNGVSLGTDTPFVEVQRLDLIERITFIDRLRIGTAAPESRPQERHENLADTLATNLAGLKEYASAIVEQFGNNINVALSGGYDSRLLLALFRQAGAVPNLFVYGDDASQDVRIAKKIAAAEGLPLRHIDKSRIRTVKHSEFCQIVRENFLREDCLPWGGIFINGAEKLAREWRQANGALHVNGGGGEVFRNFFYLPNRALTTRQLVWTFFSQYDPAQCSDRFDTRVYEDGIAKKAADVLGLQDDRLSRRDAEALYPYLRCRSWFGRENSINNRWGWSILPFFDHKTVAEALRIPLKYKRFGNFEAAMIRLTDPTLAAYESNYGHNFSQDAPIGSALSESLNYARPPWLRRYAFRIKARIRPAIQRSELLSRRVLDGIIDTGFPYMSSYFRMDQPFTNEMYGRICTLEYLYASLGAQTTSI